MAQDLCEGHAPTFLRASIPRGPQTARVSCPGPQKGSPRAATIPRDTRSRFSGAGSRESGRIRRPREGGHPGPPSLAGPPPCGRDGAARGPMAHGPFDLASRESPRPAPRRAFPVRLPRAGRRSALPRARTACRSGRRSRAWLPFPGPLAQGTPVCYPIIHPIMRADAHDPRARPIGGVTLLAPAGAKNLPAHGFWPARAQDSVRRTVLRCTHRSTDIMYTAGMVGSTVYPGW